MLLYVSCAFDRLNSSSRNAELWLCKLRETSVVRVLHLFLVRLVGYLVLIILEISTCYEYITAAVSSHLELYNRCSVTSSLVHV